MAIGRRVFAKWFGVMTLMFAAAVAKGQSQLVVNGGFETGTAAPWVLGGSAIANNGYTHSGTYLLWLGGIAKWNDSAYQTITVPMAISSAQLSFFYNISSADTNTTAVDTFTATVQDTNGVVLATIGNWSNINRDPAPGNPNYHQQTFNLYPYAGKTIRICFASSNNASLTTSFFVDDVTVQTTAATGPADLMPQNIFLMPNPAVVGGALTVSYSVANIGGTAAPASHTKVTIKDSANNVLNQQVFATAALGAGATTNESRTLALTGATPGTYSVVVSTDCNSEVTQTNRTNDVSPAAALPVQAAAGLVIKPIFDVSISNDPNGVAIQNAINAAITAYERMFSDPITVNIHFTKMTNGLGQSTTYIGSISYSDFLAALADKSMTTNDAIALTYLPTTSSNPVNGNPDMSLTTANLRALGIAASPPTGQPDSHIALNFSIMNLSRANPDPSKYDLISVAQHEIDEALGLGTALNGLANGAPAPSTAVRVMDLYRYGTNGARSFNTASNTIAYFSIDGGKTLLAQFNQKQNADFQDWATGTGQVRVQDAFGTPGTAPNLNVELTALDVCGWTLASAISKPAIVSMRPSNGNMIVTWTSQANLSYQLQAKTDMTGSWVNLGSPVVSAGSTTSTSTAMTSAQTFYRVVLVSGTQSAAMKAGLAQRVSASMTRANAEMRGAHAVVEE